MPIESKFTRCEPDDPRRCQGTTAKNQCPFKAVDTSEYCPMHGGVFAVRGLEAARKRVYNLAKWQDRVNEHADHEHVKSLREEVGIARMLLEGVISMCKDQSDLLMYSNKISDLVTRVEKLVTSCHRLEASTGMLLDKHAALQIAQRIVAIVAEHVVSEDAIELMAKEIVRAILGTKPEVT